MPTYYDSTGGYPNNPEDYLPSYGYTTVQTPGDVNGVTLLGDAGDNTLVGTDANDMLDGGGGATATRWNLVDKYVDMALANTISTPHSSAYNAGSAVEITVTCKLMNVLSGNDTLVDKMFTGGSKAYYFETLNGKLWFYYSTDGSTFSKVSSTANLPFDNGAIAHIKVAFTGNDGGGNHTT